MKYSILEKDNVKCLISEEYNYMFNYKTGFFARWGRTKESDPDYSFFGPEIADIEITTKCDGINGKVCSFCYKANTPNGINMSFDTFKNIFDKLPKTLTQIAFGADSHATSNPDLWKMMDYCRENKVIPNITVADISDETADNLAKYVGATAVSYYPQQDKNACYNSVKKLTDRDMNQINIHCFISEETYEDAMNLLSDVKTDIRLSKLNAIVFLSLKKKGRGVNYHSLSNEKFKVLVDKCLNENISFGFDSCSCNKFVESVKDNPKYEKLATCSEPCESSIFSMYISAEGIYYPCSFCENVKEGIDMTKITDFMKDVWYSDKVKEFRKHLLGNKDSNGYRKCPVYNI